MLDSSHTFMFWDLVLGTELLIMVFVRAHRENDFELYIEVLDNLVFLFFALDHYNNCRWASVHLRDMRSLFVVAKNTLEDGWVVQKTSNICSCIPIEQDREQENAKVQGSGGIIGVTEDPSALKQWTISGPDKARILIDFEETLWTYVVFTLPYLTLMKDVTDSVRHHERSIQSSCISERSTQSV